MWDAVQRGARVVLTALAFTGFFTGGLLLSWTVLPLIALFSRDRLVRARRCQRVLRAAFRVFHGYMRWVRILHFDPRAVRVTLPDGPCVIIANHPTLVDVTALVTVLREVTVVAKPAMYRSFLVGPLLRFCFHIEGAREPMADGARVLQDCLDRLAQGLPVLMFPEGTRSPIGGLGRFKRGAFELAARAKVPLVRFGIRCEPAVLSRQHPWWTTPSRVPYLTIEQLPTLAIAAFDAHAAETVSDVQKEYGLFVTDNINDRTNPGLQAVSQELAEGLAGPDCPPMK